MVLLLIMEFLIFAAFRLILGNPFHERFEQYVNAGSLIIGTLTEEALTLPGRDPENPYPKLRDLFTELDSRYGLMVWIESGGKYIVKSFQGEPSFMTPAHRSIERENYRVSWGKRNENIHMILPLKTATIANASLHLYYARRGVRAFERDFALALAFLGLIMALLIFPLSRYITEPLKKLKASALRISWGRLQERVQVRGRDEIGELADAFNTMAEKLEYMVTGTKMLTAHISHELRSPLARIRIAGELLEDRLKGNNTGACLPLLETIKEEIQDMDTLIGRILQLTKMDIHGAESMEQSFDAAAMARDAVKRFEPVLESRSLHFSLDIPEVQFLMTGDPDDIKTAFNNIIDNAVKYSPPGSSIQMEMKRAGDGMTLTVKNDTLSPVGTDPEKLLQPFQRGKNADIPGYGLGLAIVQKIVENHGGALTLYWRENRFEIYLSFPLEAVNNGNSYRYRNAGK